MLTLHGCTGKYVGQVEKMQRTLPIPLYCYVIGMGAIPIYSPTYITCWLATATWTIRHEVSSEQLCCSLLLYKCHIFMLYVQIRDSFDVTQVSMHVLISYRLYLDG